MTEQDNSHSLIPRPDVSLANTAAGPKRILSAMVGDALALGREEAVAQSARFRIGDYIWCEPDYRQILLWAETLKMEPLTVIEHLLDDYQIKVFLIHLALKTLYFYFQPYYFYFQLYYFLKVNLKNF